MRRVLGILVLALLLSSSIFTLLVYRPQPPPLQCVLQQCPESFYLQKTTPISLGSYTNGDQEVVIDINASSDVFVMITQGNFLLTSATISPQVPFSYTINNPRGSYSATLSPTSPSLVSVSILKR